MSYEKNGHIASLPNLHDTHTVLLYSIEEVIWHALGMVNLMQIKLNVQWS